MPPCHPIDTPRMLRKDQSSISMPLNQNGSNFLEDGPFHAKLVAVATHFDSVDPILANVV